ncbi:MAG: hypothetical protein RLZZ210_1366 [Pseudomonadota bacterium]
MEIIILAFPTISTNGLTKKQQNKLNRSLQQIKLNHNKSLILSNVDNLPIIKYTANTVSTPKSKLNYDSLNDLALDKKSFAPEYLPLSKSKPDGKSCWGQRFFVNSSSFSTPSIKHITKIKNVFVQSVIIKNGIHGITSKPIKVKVLDLANGSRLVRIPLYVNGVKSFTIIRPISKKNNADSNRIIVNSSFLCAQSHGNSMNKLFSIKHLGIQKTSFLTPYGTKSLQSNPRDKQFISIIPDENAIEVFHKTNPNFSYDDIVKSAGILKDTDDNYLFNHNMRTNQKKITPEQLKDKIRLLASYKKISSYEFAKRADRYSMDTLLVCKNKEPTLLDAVKLTSKIGYSNVIYSMCRGRSNIPYGSAYYENFPTATQEKDGYIYSSEYKHKPRNSKDDKYEKNCGELSISEEFQIRGNKSFSPLQHALIRTKL